jgi:hypothetical protein
MNQKYRIKEAGGYFIPQWRGWFLWHYFTDGDIEYPGAVRYDTLEEARAHIARAIAVNAKPIIHSF